MENPILQKRFAALTRNPMRLALFSSLALAVGSVQAALVTIQAESGTIGGDLVTGSSGGVTYISSAGTRED